MWRARWELTGLAILTFLLQHIRQLINQPLRINKLVSHRVALSVRIHYTPVDSDFQKMQIRIRILRLKFCKKYAKAFLYLHHLNYLSCQNVTALLVGKT